MSKVLLVVAFATALASVTPAIHANSAGAFVSLDAGRSHNEVSRLEFRDRTDLAYGVLVGYRWALRPSFYMGVEGGYAHLGKAKDHTVDDYVFQGVDGPHAIHEEDRRYDKSRALMLGVNMRWELPGHWALTAHGGRARYRTNFVIESYGSFDDLSYVDRSTNKHSNNGSYYGIGIGYDVTRHFGLTAAYDRYNPVFAYVPGDTATHKVEVVGIRGEYRF